MPWRRSKSIKSRLKRAGQESGLSYGVKRLQPGNPPRPTGRERRLSRTPVIAAAKLEDERKRQLGRIKDGQVRGLSGTEIKKMGNEAPEDAIWRGAYKGFVFDERRKNKLGRLARSTKAVQPSADRKKPLSPDEFTRQTRLILEKFSGARREEVNWGRLTWSEKIVVVQRLGRRGFDISSYLREMGISRLKALRSGIYTYFRRGEKIRYNARTATTIEKRK